MRIRQSDLKLWARCPLAWRYQHIDGIEREQGASSVFGSLVHDCVLYLETTGDLQGAIDRFITGWLSPVGLLGQDKGRIDYYERGRNWKKFNETGPRILRDWWSIIQWEGDVVLAREYSFDVPIGNGHTLHGTIDKLALRYMPKVNKHVVLISDYKDLALDTPLPTPDGWTAMGSVRVGDLVIGGDGRPCTVVAKSSVYSTNDCYRVTFDDGSTIVAGAEHLWSVSTDAGEQIMTTVEMAANLHSEATGQRHLRIPNVTTLLPTADLPIDPYVLGAWLGDGSAASGVITKPLPALFQEIERRGFPVGPDISGNGGMSRTVYGLSLLLREQGLLGNKHIPARYLRASVGQRLDLLRGIMDTDGHWNATRKRCVLNTTDERFARQVYELAVSLGWKAATFVTTATGFGKSAPAWQTWFTPVDADVFLARRPEGYRAEAPVKSRRRLVTSVEPTLSVPTQCIQVDSPDQTYLCGEQMVRTHNTNANRPTYDYLADDLQFTAYGHATLQEEFWTGIQNGDQIFQRVADHPRWGEWVQLQGPTRLDAGERKQHHYNRLTYAINAMADSVAMRIFVPNISGASCRYCEFRKRCGLPELDDDGNEI